MKGWLIGLEMGWIPHRIRRLRYRWQERKKRLRRLSTSVIRTPLILSDHGAAWCPLCHKQLVAYRGSDREDILVCPFWHYGMVLLSGFDIRSHNSMIEAMPAVREQLVGTDRLQNLDGEWVKSLTTH